jgi:hypothetical protein
VSVGRYIAPPSRTNFIIRNIQSREERIPLRAYIVEHPEPDAGKLRPLISTQQFSASEIDAAHALVETGALGKVVVDLE